MKEDNKKLKRELEKEKKVTAILCDATIFSVRITRSEIQRGARRLLRCH